MYKKTVLELSFFCSVRFKNFRKVAGRNMYYCLKINHLISTPRDLQVKMKLDYESLKC